MTAFQINLLLAWVWICLGFLSGLGLGLFFQRVDWLGGYSSLKRRLYRLCHISFFGLGVLNLCFYLTIQWFDLRGAVLQIASWAFIAGAVSMPVCCLLMAHFPRVLPLFGVPVVSLLLGGVLTVVAVAQLNPRGRTRTTFFQRRVSPCLQGTRPEVRFAFQDIASRRFTPGLPASASSANHSYL